MPDTMTPGWPGRGYDPTAGFTDMQWYMYHQRNVAHFAAFSADRIDGARLLGIARNLLAAAPHFDLGWRGSGRPVADETLARLGTIEEVESFDGLPDRWLDDPLGVFGDADLPLFRLRVARLAGDADDAGRRSLLLVQVAHCLTEGSDSALLARSHPADHVPVASRAAPLHVALPARLLGALAALLHLLAARVLTPHPGRIRAVTRAWPRAPFAQWARRLGVSQRALYLGLAAHVINRAGMPGGKRHITCTYSTLSGSSGARDPFMRMHMLLAAFVNRPDLEAFVRAVDDRLKRESGRSGFNTEMNSAAIAMHRRLAGAVPFLYGPRVFGFMPYDLVFGLLPPHRLGGTLTEGLIEPVHAGAMLPGVNACVVVPGREQVSFGFYLEQGLTGEVARLDALVATEFERVAGVPSPAKVAAS